MKTKKDDLAFDVFNAVVASMVSHWHAGIRQPELQLRIGLEFPAITDAQFNDCADAAWLQIDLEEYAARTWH